MALLTGFIESYQIVCQTNDEKYQATRLQTFENRYFRAHCDNQE